jgi:antirestriction protein ArdC
LDEAKKLPATQLVKTAFLNYYRVFNIDDILHIDFNIPDLAPERNHNTIERCEAVILEMQDCPEIRNKENQAYYHPVYDFINMSPIELFKTPELYFSILLDKVIHCTRHPKRLNRFEGNEISTLNSANYSKDYPNLWH